MGSSRLELAAAIARLAPHDGLHATSLNGVHCARYSTIDRGAKRQWRACLAVVAQGCKEVLLGRRVYRCEEGRFTAAPIPLPVVSRIAVADATRPFLGILIDLEPIILAEVAAQIEGSIGERESRTTLRAFFTGDAEEGMIDGAARLARALAAPEAARALGPWIIRETFYFLLRGPEGASIRQFVLAGSAMHRIANAVFIIKTNLHKPIDVDALAKGETATAGKTRASEPLQHVGRSYYRSAQERLDLAFELLLARRPHVPAADRAVPCDQKRHRHAIERAVRRFDRLVHLQHRLDHGVIRR